ncbi:MAG: radical SAM family heme chaperone HemW [Deltaproteobacteria bacterium]|nr:radical SAM family heme chaperone HemW [Deltaproteobacteria bacterium]
MENYSIYIHLPFCRSRCPYCDFFSTETGSIPFVAYREAIHREWDLRQHQMDSRSLLSIYVGGGTPSLWPVEELCALLAPFRPYEGAEVTIEVNPGDATDEWFGGMTDLGVNRFSIGVQALDDTRLELLGRRHDRRRAEEAVRLAIGSRARSVGADLIWGTPGQDKQGLANEIRALAELGVSHVSAYELTVAEGTAWQRKVASCAIHMPSNDAMAELWYVVGNTLASCGYARYEVSNYAKPGHRSRHNLHYWRGGIYVGLGAGAHGFVVEQEGDMIRYSNAAAVDSYLQSLGSPGDLSASRGVGKPATNESISPETYARERVMLGLRTSEGVAFEDVLSTLDQAESARWRVSAKELEEQGLVRLEQGRLAPTARGMLQADALAMQFF